MCAPDPGEVFQEIETVVPACEEVRRISGGAVNPGKAHRREAFLIGGRRYSLQSVAFCKIESTIFTLLTARHAQESKPEFAHQIRSENVCIADGDTSRTGRQVVTEARNKTFIQLAAAEWLERFEIRLVQPQK